LPRNESTRTITSRRYDFVTIWCRAYRVQRLGEVEAAPGWRFAASISHDFHIAFHHFVFAVTCPKKNREPALLLSPSTHAASGAHNKGDRDEKKCENQQMQK
jgi:hypothetical protein